MPIADTEWNDGGRADSASMMGATSVDEYDDEEALTEIRDELVVKGIIAEQDVETGVGTTTYYRRNTHEPWG